MWWVLSLLIVSLSAGEIMFRHLLFFVLYFVQLLSLCGLGSYVPGRLSHTLNCECTLSDTITNHCPFSRKLWKHLCFLWTIHHTKAVFLQRYILKITVTTEIKQLNLCWPQILFSWTLKLKLTRWLCLDVSSDNCHNDWKQEALYWSAFPSFFFPLCQSNEGLVGIFATYPVKNQFPWLQWYINKRKWKWDWQ